MMKQLILSKATEISIPEQPLTTSPTSALSSPSRGEGSGNRKKLNTLFKLLPLTALAMLLCSACINEPKGTPQERYEAALAKGLASEEVTNDLFLGLELAVTDKQFYDRCTELNKQQKVTMGSGGNRVDYKLGDALPRPATLTYYPDFSEDRPRIIKAMDMEIIYDDWSPWNKDAHTPKLMADVAKWAKKKFGDGFEIVDHPQHQKVIVQVKNNRRITFWALDTKAVRGRITDLNALPNEPLGLE